MNFDYGAALKMPRIRAPRRKKTCGAGLKKKAPPTISRKALGSGSHMAAEAIAKI